MDKIAEDETLWSIVYISSAGHLLTDTELDDLLEKSRRNNPAKDITGILLYQDGNFMQLIEGPKTAAYELYEKICKDPLHEGLITLLQQPIEERLFSGWAMEFRDINKLTVDEKLRAQPYYDGSLDAEQYVREPSKSLLLLRSFVTTAR